MLKLCASCESLQWSRCESFLAYFWMESSYFFVKKVELSKILHKQQEKLEKAFICRGSLIRESTSFEMSLKVCFEKQCYFYWSFTVWLLLLKIFEIYCKCNGLYVLSNNTHLSQNDKRRSVLPNSGFVLLQCCWTSQWMHVQNEYCDP